MDYLFENLGPERFEQFCHSLLSYEFPKFQCFPVGQPDGGRDAVAYFMSENATKFVVFQVKFVRKPQTIVDPHKWLVEKLEEEVPKIQKLIPKGAKEYYLLTNVPGTAHPDSGSIDKVQTILNNSLRLPSYCWWRDDLNSKLDGLWDLKWAYPEILTGVDMLRHREHPDLGHGARR